MRSSAWVSAWLVIVSSSSCSESKFLAASVTIGFNSKGSFVPNARIRLRRTGAGVKTEEPSKPTRPSLLGAGFFLFFFGGFAVGEVSHYWDHDLAIHKCCP